MEPITKATIHLVNSCFAKIHPTFKTPHYIFSMRDISKIFQGLLLSSPWTVDNSKSLVILWAHECKRILKDKLTNHGDRQTFEHILSRTLMTHLNESVNLDNLYMVNFLHAPMDGKLIYEYCDNYEKLYSVMRS